MVATENWVFLVYWLPREPSTPRISVWRKLRRLGVAHLSDGLVALPYGTSTKEQLEWVAQEIVEASGDATIWITTPTVKKFGRSLARALAAERATEYGELIEHVEAAFTAETGERSRALKRLRAEYRRVERRDYFPTPEKAETRKALERLAASLDVGVSR